jgi:carboxylesterase type B
VLGSACGAFHGLELFYVFQTFEYSSFARAGIADDTAVESNMLGNWTRFASTGDPARGSAVTRSAHTADDSDPEIAPTSVAGQGVRTTACDLWDTVTGL